MEDVLVHVHMLAQAIVIAVVQVDVKMLVTILVETVHMNVAVVAVVVA